MFYSMWVILQFKKIVLSSVKKKKKKAKKLKDQDINWIVHMDSEVIQDGG